MRFHKDATKEQFKNEVVKNDHSIVAYGFGVIGKTVLPFFLDEAGLSDRIMFIADADVHKQGESITVGKNSIVVQAPDKMKEINDNFVILITGSRFEKIAEYLDACEWLKDTDVFLLPQMLIEKTRTIGKYDNCNMGMEPLIPKTIHYCWFGNKEIPDRLKKCIESWQKYCPDYKVIRWSEENYNIEQHEYTKKAYEHKKWALIPDVVRLEVLLEHGGIYLDTDVELIKPLDSLLNQKGFVGVEKWGIINVGGGCGVVRHHPMMLCLLEKRLGVTFERTDGSLNMESSGSYETIPFIENGFIPNNTVQIINEMTVYSSDFFHPYDYMTKELSITENTYSIHRFAESWVK